MTLSRDQIGAALADSAWAFARELQGAKRNDSGFGTVIRSDAPFGDGNVVFVHSEKQAERLVAAADRVRGMFPEGFPWRVHVPSESRTAVVRALGVRYIESEEVMVIPEARPRTSYVPIQKVRDNAELGAFRSILAESFKFKRWAVDVAFPRVPSRSDDGIRTLLMFGIERDGHRIGTSAVVVSDSIGVLSNIGVPRRNRRLGYGKMLTAAAVGYGIDLGAEEYVLLATDMGAPLYRSVGFYSVGSYIVLENKVGFFDRARNAHTLRQMVEH